IGLPTQPVERKTVPRTYLLDGVAEATKQSTVTAQTRGQILKVHFDVDDYVHTGDLLIELKDTELRSGLEKAEADQRSARAGLLDAQRDYQRMREVYEKKAVSKADFDKAGLALKAAKARLQAADAAVEQAREQLSYARILAPYDGIVIQRNAEVGELAQPGTPLMKGLSLDSMRVSVDVPQTLAGAVRENREARVQLPSGEWLAIEDMTIFPVVNARSNTFKVRLQLPSGLKDIFPGMYLKVAFTSGEKSSLLIPADSVVHRSEVVGVYILQENGRVTFRHIRLGKMIEPGVLTVLSGLEEGEQIALDPIAAGAALKMQREAPANGH
ncbi:MAG: efflux RND transporter periplasmic adaptor subunit, partial [Gammaproteobacteria bacterium]